MLRYTFLVDTDLRLQDWDDNLRRLRGLTLDSLAGRLYSQVLPQILIDGADAVEAAIAGCKEFRCSGYRISCFFGEVEADIIITPVVEDGVSTGAEVAIFADHPCSISRRFEQVQPLVDIAKSSASVAHGVRNPLNAIKGAVTYIAGKYGNDANLLEFTGIIQEEIEKLNAFITRFLSNSDARRESRLVDLNETVRKMCFVTELQAAPKGIHLYTSLSDVPPVAGDEFQLEHALLNVVNNALEAMSDGGQVSLTTAGGIRDGVTTVSVKISDNGPGFVCEPASLEYPREDRTAIGRGFGLFLSREIIQSHGGKLEIFSERGKGTTILVSLPAAVTDDK